MTIKTFDELVAEYMRRGATRAEAEQAAAFALDGPHEFAEGDDANASD